MTLCVTHLVDERKTEDIVYLDFSKAFDAISDYLPREAGNSWLGRVYSYLDKKLPG